MPSLRLSSTVSLANLFLPHARVQWVIKPYQMRESTLSQCSYFPASWELTGLALQTVSGCVFDVDDPGVADTFYEHLFKETQRWNFSAWHHSSCASTPPRCCQTVRRETCFICALGFYSFGEMLGGETFVGPRSEPQETSGWVGILSSETISTYHFCSVILTIS